MLISRFPALARSLTLASCLLAGWAQAEQKQDFADYSVHYSALNTSFLTPEVAQAYGIIRSNSRGLLNIAVQHQGKPSTALVSGQVTNLIGQIRELSFKEVREQDAIYYLSEFGFTNDELLTFKLSIQPDVNASAHELQFQQRFYSD
ncbi:DUF4426 domain-containing protein [Balneatrix alpica]|uniref:DUF4426 domain-containing protein n=1 Tax=Balneatrix alpica TaxID=75684 RepID=A0ABV5ZA68_9GAMM|nr:DUF4426 domain-containing protein [Balneatrix alpica]